MYIYTPIYTLTCMSMYSCICMYIYLEREREICFYGMPQRHEVLITDAQNKHNPLQRGAPRVHVRINLKKK